MAYSKQNFHDGQILTAANLEKMENGIIAGQGAKNLLVNSNFRNPINTNGQTNYSGSTASSIDKWGLIKGASDSIISLKISNNGIILSKSANVSSFEQKLSIDISNKQITYAIKTSEGITLGTCIASATANYIRIGTHTGYLSTVSSNGITTFSIYFNDTSSDSITLEWAALYEGNYTKDTLPDYMPNTKQVEMLNCGIPLTPHNLLDNSNFINAINQGGQTSWTAHGVYCIDRWKTESANNAANISYTKGSGITLTPSSKNYAGIIQQFENYSSMTGKVYTIAVCINNVWYSGTFTMGATPSGGVVLSNGIRIYSASGYNVLIRNPAGQSAITIQRAALYEGSYDASTLPPYAPKGKHVEMLNCNVPLAPRNLLDNSDFRNPVNQRGQGSYTNGYSIDRWRADGDSSAVISSSGISVSNTSFRQYVMLPAGTYTLAFKVSYGTLLYYNFTYDGASTITKIGGANEMTGAYINLYNNAKGVVACQFVLGADYMYTLAWAALYEGSYDASTLPPYVPKGYAAELAECQRYYWRYWQNNNFDIGHGYMNTTDTANITFDFPTKMRTAPTITFGNISSLRVMCVNGLKGITSYSVVKTTDKQMMVGFTLDSTSTAFTPCVMRSNNGIIIEFSADL